MKYVLTCTAAFFLLLQATPPVFAQGSGSEWDILSQEVVELYRTGKYDRAVLVARKALEIAEKNVGPNHPDVATSLNNLAFLYFTQGHYAQAEPLYKRALAIREKVLGPDHPDVAQTLNYLAALDRATNRDEYIAPDIDAAKKSAEALPIDYLELVYLVVMDMAGPPPLADKDQLSAPPARTQRVRHHRAQREAEVYLSIFDDDPTAELLQKFSKAGLAFRPGSTFTPSKVDGTEKLATVGNKFLFSVDGAERLGEDRYLLKAGYYCGLLCSAEIDHILHFDGEKFEIVERTTLWIS